jgi:hypothetical protein
MRKDRFTDEAVTAAYALANLKYSESEEDQLRFSEAYNFTTCERPDGTRYGTRGKCRKGTETAGGPKEEGLKKTAAEMKGNRAAYLGEKADNLKAGPHAKEISEKKSQLKDKLTQLKERKAELDRVTRAYTAQAKLVKKERTKENIARLKLVAAALRREESSHRRTEREADQLARQLSRLNRRNERAKMSPAQLAEERRIDALIRKLG